MAKLWRVCPLTDTHQCHTSSSAPTEFWQTTVLSCSLQRLSVTVHPAQAALPQWQYPLCTTMMLVTSCTHMQGLYWHIAHHLSTSSPPESHKMSTSPMQQHIQQNCRQLRCQHHAPPQRQCHSFCGRHQLHALPQE